MPKRPNPMAVRKAMTYTAQEAALALNVSLATIRNYVRRGLPVMSNKKPLLISGEAIREFLRDERSSRRIPLQDDELMCPRCKRGRRPFGMIVDLFVLTPKTANLAGLCEVCEGGSNRMISLAKRQDFAARFDITER